MNEQAVTQTTTTQLTNDINAYVADIDRPTVYVCIIFDHHQPGNVEVRVIAPGIEPWWQHFHAYQLHTELGLLALADSITIPGYTAHQGCGNGGEITTKYVRN